MEKVRELEQVAISSSSDVWIDLTEAMKKPVDLSFDFQCRPEKAETDCGEESTKPRVEEELVQPHLKEEKVLVVKGDVKKPIVIDLDTCEDVEEPSDTYMALVVVPDPPQGIVSSNTELAIVRVDNTEIGETISQSDVQHDQTSTGFQSPTAEVSAECQSPGNELVDPRGVLDPPPRWASSKVGILTVQCARCLKWRVVPSREIYEAIREHILETPWVCENALQWRPDAHCDFPTDLNQDSQTLWAIDKPNLPSSPPGWSRKVIVRRDCSTRFADVYYTAPDGKTLRSMVEVAKYLEENRGSVPEGTQLNQFSFTIPQPLPGVWTAKKRNSMRSVVNLSSSQGKGKKARAPQPLAKQLAQRLLHSNSPPLLPVPPSFPLPSAPLFQLQATLPGPFVPQIGQPSATQVPAYPPVPNFRHPPTVPLCSSPLPSMRNPYPFPPSHVGTPSQALPQDPSYSLQQGMQISNAGKPDSSSTTAPSRSKKQQQKSRLGGTTSVNLPGVLPLREPDGC